MVVAPNPRSQRLTSYEVKSALSKHLTHLTEAGYARQDRVIRDSRSRLWLSLTHEGARAYRAHVQALQQITATDES